MVQIFPQRMYTCSLLLTFVNAMYDLSVNVEYPNRITKCGVIMKSFLHTPGKENDTSLEVGVVLTGYEQAVKRYSFRWKRFPVPLIPFWAAVLLWYNRVLNALLLLFPVVHSESHRRKCLQMSSRKNASCAVWYIFIFNDCPVRWALSGKVR